MTGKQTRNPLRIRGLMVDPARLVERHEFYFELIERMARWGFNTLWWHFSDDQGFALKLDGHPELATPYAFTKAKMRRLIRRAGELGIDVVPEVESLGHARYVTRLPRYAHLADGGKLGFNAMCPSHPDTLKLLREIIGEVAGLFQSPYVHAGLDEVSFGDCPRCTRRARGRPAWFLYAEHVKAVRDIVASLGKRMIMWADHVESEPALLKVIPKDVILAHWQYVGVDAKPIRRSLDAGFEVICAPAILHWQDVIQPNAGNFRNTEEMTIAAAKLAPRGVLGVVNTWWTTWRILRDAATPGIAFTGEVFSQAAPADRLGFMRRFVSDFFGLPSAPVARAMWRLHSLTLNASELNACLFDSPADVHALLTLAGSEGFDTRAAETGKCASDLRSAGKRVRSHRAEYDAITLAGGISSDCLDRGLRLREAYEAYRQAERLHDNGAERRRVAERLTDAAAALSATLKRLERLCAAVEKEWDRTRHPRDAKKANRNVETTPCGFDVLLGRMLRCRGFLRRLVANLRKGISTYRRTGGSTRLTASRFPTGL